MNDCVDLGISFFDQEEVALSLDARILGNRYCVLVLVWIWSFMKIVFGMLGLLMHPLSVAGLGKSFLCLDLTG